MDKKSAVCLAIFGFSLTSCSFIDTKHAPQDKSFNYPLIQNKSTFNPPKTKSYLRTVSKMEMLNQKKISYANPSVSLIDVLSTHFPEYNIVPADPGVALISPIAISVSQMPGARFLDYLEGITGYAIEMQQKSLVVSSRLTKQWNLAAFASLREFESKTGQHVSGVTEGTKGAAGGAGATTIPKTATQLTSSSLRDGNNQWELIVGNARSIVGASETAGSTAGVVPMPARGSEGIEAVGIEATGFGFAPPQDTSDMGPYVVGNRSLGILMASGAPRRIKILDQYLKTLNRASTQQVNIDMKAFDVTLDDTKGSGIDWNAFRTGRFKFGVGVGGTGFPSTASIADGVGVSGLDPSGVVASAAIKSGLWSSVFSYVKDDNKVNLGIRFLSQYGKVQLINEPNITTLNGTTAYLSSGDEFSYVSDLEQRQDGTNSATIVVTPKFSRIRVGVTMAVTPRVLEDNRILLEVIPVVSSLQGFTDFETSSNFVLKNKIQTPKIALQDLSTQVITHSGHTVQLGGLLHRKIEESLTRIPTRHKGITELLDLFFKSNSSQLKRRELVLFITPTLIEDSKWPPSMN